MNTDIVERLRTDVLWHRRRDNETIARDCQEAADEIERLRAALAESCEEHRSAVYDTTTGGGCVLLRDAVAAERERCAKIVEEFKPPATSYHIRTELALEIRRAG